MPFVEEIPRRAHWGSHDFIHAVEDVFMSTVEEDSGMSELAIDTVYIFILGNFPIVRET